MLLKVKTRTIDNQTALEVWEIGGKLLFKKYVESPIHAPTDTLSVGMPDKLSCAVRRLKRRTVADLPDAEVERKYRKLAIIEDLPAIINFFPSTFFYVHYVAPLLTNLGWPTYK